MARDASAAVSELWKETFGEEPSIDADVSVTLHVLVRCLPDPGPFSLGQAMAPPYARTDAILASNADQSSEPSIADQMDSTSSISISCGSDLENTGDDSLSGRSGVRPASKDLNAEALSAA